LTASRYTEVSGRTRAPSKNTEAVEGSGGGATCLPVVGASGGGASLVSVSSTTHWSSDFPATIAILPQAPAPLMRTTMSPAATSFESTLV